MDSLLSQDILKFYNVDGLLCLPIESFFKDTSYDFHQLAFLIMKADLSELDAVQLFDTYEYKDFAKIYEMLLPVFARTDAVLKLIPQQSLMIKWIPGYEELALFAQRHRTYPEVMGELLHVTSWLEYGLMRLVRVVSRTQGIPPWLLHGPLDYSLPLLRRCLGHEPTLFLRFLLGSHSGVNLKNLLWHGYLPPHEIPTFYISVIILMAHSFGLVLSERMDGAAFELLLGYPVSDAVQHPDRMCELYIHTDTNDLLAMLLECTLMPKIYRSFWQYFIIQWSKLSPYEIDKRWKFLLTILPQIEMLVRLMYGHVNECSVVATLDAPFIDMATMFEPFLPTALKPSNQQLVPNKLFNTAGPYAYPSDSVLNLLYDLFVPSSGPNLLVNAHCGQLKLRNMGTNFLCETMMALGCDLLRSLANMSRQRNNMPLLDFPSSVGKYRSQYHSNACARNNLESVHYYLTTMQNQYQTESANYPQFVYRTEVCILRRSHKDKELMPLLVAATSALSYIIRRISMGLRESIIGERLLPNELRLRLRMRKCVPKIMSTIHNLAVCCAKILDQLDTQPDSVPHEDTTLFLTRAYKILGDANQEWPIRRWNEWMQIWDCVDAIKSNYFKL